MNRSGLVSRVAPRRIEALLWVWLALGAALVVLAPGLRSVDAQFGWLPYWLIVAPLLDLALINHQRLSATARVWLSRTRRRRRHLPRQARPLHRRQRRQTKPASTVSGVAVLPGPAFSQ